MRILVAGATSFVGQLIVRRMLDAGWHVRFFTRRTEADPVVRDLARAGADPCRGDFSRAWTLLSAGRNAEAFLNVAHIRHARLCIGLCRTLNCARYIQFSSTRGLSRFERHAGVAGVRRGEQMIQRSGLDHTIIRPTMMFGGANDGNLSRVARWVMARRLIPALDGGKCVVQPVLADDVAVFVLEALRRPDVSTGRVYTLAGERPVTLAELYALIASVAHRPRPIILPVPGGAAHLLARRLEFAWSGATVYREYIERGWESRAADAQAARADFDFQPTDYETALRIMVERIRLGG